MNLKVSFFHRDFDGKAVSVLLVVLVLMWSLGVPFLMHDARAAALTDISDTLSDSDLNVGANHDVAFTNSTRIQAGETITVTFDPDTQAFDLTSLATTSVDITGGSINEVADSGACGATVDIYISSIDRTNDVITFTMCGGAADIATSTSISVTTANNEITNPNSEDSFKIEIGGTMPDTGTTMVAIINDVLVTADVETTLTFVISGVAGSQSVNGTSTTIVTTATTVPFGTLAPGDVVTGAQDLSVITNAPSGFTVTVNADQPLTSSAGADIDTFSNGASTSVPILWTDPTGTAGNEDTYGHMGLTSEDATMSAGDEFGSDLWAGNYVNNPRAVLYATTSADGTTPNVGATRVGYQVEISSLQEAGDDYQTSLTYVATPIF